MQQCPSNIYFKCIRLCFLKSITRMFLLFFDQEKPSRAPITLKLWRMAKDQRDRAPLADQEPWGSHAQIGSGTLWMYHAHDQPAYFTHCPRSLFNRRVGRGRKNPPHISLHKALLPVSFFLKPVSSFTKN